MRSKALVEIEFLDKEGKPVEPIFELETSYIIKPTVTNKTMTTGEHPWGAELEVGIGISLNGIDILPYTIYPPRASAPEQSIEYPFQIYIPKEYAGLTGKVLAKVSDPFGGVLAKAKKPFKIGYEVSPEAAYQPLASGEGLKGIDMPFLNPALDNSDGQVVLGGGVSRPPSPPPPQPAPKIDYSKAKPPPGIDLTSEPELEVEFEGEGIVDGRLG